MSAVPLGAGTAHDLDEARALELIFGAEDPGCDGFGNPSCEDEVEYLMVCACNAGAEQLCAKCAAAAFEHSKHNFRIEHLNVGYPMRFSRSCGHSVFLSDCTIRPI